MLQFPHPVDVELLSPLVESILAKATALSFIPVTQSQQTRVLHRQILKSSLYSARIEGNDLTLVQARQADLSSPKEKSQLEISNVLNVLQHISVFTNQKFDTTLLLTLHAQIMKGLHANAGKFRVESSAIFDGMGNAVYVTPGPKEMKDMLDVLFDQVKTLFSDVQNNQVSVTGRDLAIIAHSHYYFEKIHPFVDGNGQLGRVLLHLLLQRVGLATGWILPIDEYLEKHRSEYYYFLEKNSRNQDKFVMFLLQALDFGLTQLLTDIKETPSTEEVESAQEYLLPRRQELKAIITDHPYCSLDMLARRFPSIPRRTIAYDVNWLVKHGHVIKYGKTRGVRYGLI